MDEGKNRISQREKAVIPSPRPRILTSPNRFKLATFGFNSHGGVTITSAPGVADTDWDQQVRIAQSADRIGMEAIVPGARWLGYGGETDFQGRNFEALAWAAGLASLTQRCQVFATVHFNTIHPIRMAKTMTTIDHISRGRLGINWVAGWNADEAVMFNGSQRDHDERYEFAEEYLALLNQIFKTPGNSTFHGRYFDLERVYSEPKPIQRPRPVYMAAGLSPRGRQFAAQTSDINFVGTGESIEERRGIVADTKAMARDYGRSVSVFGQSVIVCADSEAEARDYFNWYVFEKGDPVAGRNLIHGLFGGNMVNADGSPKEMPAHVEEAMLRAAIAGHMGKVIVGTPTQVVDAYLQMADVGFDGSTVSWVNFEEGLDQFEAKILPLMIQAGLRVDESGEAAA